jgi:hypothetical protein
MSEFIVGGIILIATVNWLYSRFCEDHRRWPGAAQTQDSGSKRQEVLIGG